MTGDAIESPSSTLRVRQHLDDFAGYTTFHGFHFVIGPHGKARRLIWLVLILVGFGFCTRQLIVSYARLVAYDHVISREIIPSDKQTFPAVTVCNANMMQKSKIQGTDAQRFLDELDPTTAVSQPLNNSDFDIKNAVDQYGNKAEKMIQFCVWNGKNCNHLNFTKHYSYLYGLCYTFNSGQNGYRLQSASSKPLAGLSFILKLFRREYAGMSSYIKPGVHVLIHDQDENPDIEDDGIAVTPGYSSTIRFKKTKILKLVPPFKSACGSRKLETSNVYTRSVCLQECLTRKTITQCGCKLLGMPDLKGMKGTKYCLPQKMQECGLYTKPTINHTTEKAIPERTLLITGYTLHLNPLDCDCPVQCEQMNYETVRINSAEFISQSYALTFTKNLTDRGTDDFLDFYYSEVRDDLVHLSIHYDNLDTHITREKPSYDINDFGGSVGGYLGLFLGCSVLTICELIDLMIVWCYEWRCKRKNKFTVDKNIDGGQNVV